MLSVVVPSRNELHLVKTINNLIKNANRPNLLEIIVILDGWDRDCCEFKSVYDEFFGLMRTDWLGVGKPTIRVLENEKPLGQRVMINRAVKECSGSLFLKIDAHCIVSKGYDDAVWKHTDSSVFYTIPMFHLNESTWSVDESKLNESCSIDPTLSVRWWSGRNTDLNAETVETMAFLGTVWYCTKRLWNDIGGYTERYSGWGSSGLEFSLKTWLCGYSMRINRTLSCAHLYRKKFPYKVNGIGGLSYTQSTKDMRSEFIRGAHPKQQRKISWLVKKFWPVPLWTDSFLEALIKLENSTNG